MHFINALWWRLVRFGFRLLYNEMAFTYDWVSWIVSLGEWRSWQRATLEYLPPPSAGNVLEIAHGTGNLHLDLHQAGYALFGHDLSPAMGHITQRKFAKNSLSPKLTRGLAQSLPFADDSIAAVVSTFPTDFIIQTETLTEEDRILKPQGRFVIVLNGILTGGGIVRTFLEWLYRITGQREEKQTDAASFFEGYGFSIQVIEKTCKSSIAHLVVLTKETASGSS